MGSPIVISGGMVLAGGELLRRGDILVEGREIRRIAPKIRVRGARVIAAEGLLAAPGLIDTQVNGGFGRSFRDASPSQVAGVARRLLELGVTGFLPTLNSLPRRDTLRAIGNLAAAARSRGGARILGIHLEGPFLSPERRGTHPAENLRRPSLALFREYRRAARGLLRMMTIAPELPGALEVIREGTRRGTVMCAGHSMAAAPQVSRAILEGGLRHVTHVFNAMAPFHHRDETVLNAALLIDRLSCGMVYDRCRLSPGAAMLLMKVKPPGTLLLASDATEALGAPDGGAVPLVECVRRLIQDTGIPPSLAIHMASGVPATLLGLEGKKGILCPGADADIVLFEPGLRVRAALVEGDYLYGDLLPGGAAGPEA